ncbi:MAG TPA: hypothetical protein PLW77_05765 [Bacteroidales bacterium]|nr:hypothetical protein [Bacteroidales bacterium]HQB21391.1 hypothetical protein [Bacteroidales bacterium]
MTGDKDDLVKYRIKRAKETLEDAKLFLFSALLQKKQITSDYQKS